MRNRLAFLLSPLLALTHIASAQSKQNPSQNFTEAEAVSLVNQLLAAIVPGRPENAYMTPLMKEKINWVYAESTFRRLNILFVDNSQGALGGRNVYMSGNYVFGIPRISISANRLLEVIRLRDHIATGFNQSQKNSFALALVHEAVHLERPPSFFAEPRTKIEDVREELRACRKVDRLAVAHLLEIGQPVGVEFEEIRVILAKCGASEDCPAFQKYYIDDPGNIKRWKK